MAQQLRKAFDIAIAASVAVVIVSFALSNLGISKAEAQEQATPVVSVQFATLGN